MLSSRDAAMMFRALSDETRLKIIDMVSYAELCACAILEEFAITQPTLSYHMKILTDSGLVSSRKDGAWTYYRLNIESADSINEFIGLITSEKQENLESKHLADNCNCGRKQSCQ